MLEQPHFGQRLRALRVGRGLSQAALAGDAMSTGYLSRLESGARPPTAKSVDYLAERLDVPVSAFARERGPVLGHVLAAVTSVSDDGLDEFLADPLAEALRADDGQDPALRWQALWLLARMRGRQGRSTEEYELTAELHKLADELGVAELRVRAYTQHSRCARSIGRIAEACEYAAGAVGAAAGLTLTDRAGALHALVSAEAEAGRLAEAEAHARELCALTGPVGGSTHTRALWAAATVGIRRGAYQEANDLLERALEGLDSHEDPGLWLRLRLAAASLLLQTVPPQTAKARASLEQIGPALEIVGTEVRRQEGLLLHAQLACAEGDLARARELCDQAQALDLRLSFRDRIRLQVLSGRLDVLAGRTSLGIQRLSDLARQAVEAHNVELAAETWRTLAEALAEGRGEQG
ncbi:helix-turn-helix domain-containing protein [Streptomyces sp. NPDC051563]|uniref:helix-turn-helix domain-containing protein n=1 Tax=Streptomyces sp. NPDC051563 TaxID=3365659 RepID=UPI00378FEBDF